MRLTIKSTLLASAVATISFGIVPYLHQPLGPFDGLARFVGVPFVVVGAILCLHVVWKSAFVGHGTPAPFDPPRFLLTEGLYGRVRNPMYLGAIMIVLAEAMLFGSFGLFVYAALMWTSFHLFILYYEKPKLRAKYGKAYEET